MNDPQFGTTPTSEWKTVLCWCPGAIPAVRWTDADDTLQSAEATFDAGDVVYLTVESLNGAGYDWMVWDKARRTLPQYGRADTAAAAKHLAEQTFAVVGGTLMEGSGR